MGSFFSVFFFLGFSSNVSDLDSDLGSVSVLVLDSDLGLDLVLGSDSDSDFNFSNFFFSDFFSGFFFFDFSFDFFFREDLFIVDSYISFFFCSFFLGCFGDSPGEDFEFEYWVPTRCLKITSRFGDKEDFWRWDFTASNPHNSRFTTTRNASYDYPRNACNFTSFRCGVYKIWYAEIFGNFRAV